jgi:hypothetical protein
VRRETVQPHFSTKIEKKLKLNVSTTNLSHWLIERGNETNESLKTIERFTILKLVNAS